jgi:hypothetical protein
MLMRGEVDEPTAEGVGWGIHADACSRELEGEVDICEKMDTSSTESKESSSDKFGLFSSSG